MFAMLYCHRINILKFPLLFYGEGVTGKSAKLLHVFFCVGLRFLFRTLKECFFSVFNSSTVANQHVPKA